MKSLERSMCQEWTVDHPREITPEDLLYFVYLDQFTDDWRSLHGDDPDESALWALEILIMSNPLGGKVIQGTGGLRKLRFGSDDENQGKRGADSLDGHGVRKEQKGQHHAAGKERNQKISQCYV